jgi:hypothetical protein
MNTEKIQSLARDVQKRLRPIIEAAICIGLVFIGFQIGKQFPNLFRRPQPTLSITQATTHSVSVTDRGELIILDRGTGAISMFAPEIGENVFRAYATRMVQPSVK